MEYALVVVAAVLVGVLVYRRSLRDEQRGPGEPVAQGDQSFSAERAPTAPTRGDGAVYVPVLPFMRSWETRLTGIVGILVVISISAVALALTLYMAGSFVVGLFGDVASNGGVSGP